MHSHVSNNADDGLNGPNPRVHTKANSVGEGRSWILWGIPLGYIGIMEKKMETTMMSYIQVEAYECCKAGCLRDERRTKVCIAV